MSADGADFAELVIIAPRGRAEVVGSVLFDCGASGLQEDVLPGEARPPRQPWDSGPPERPPERVVLRTWWPVEDFERVLPTIEASVRDVAAVELRWSWVRSAEWAHDWRTSFRPIRVSERLVVAPPWDALPGDLIIEPGMAFGTGEHPTTRRCLEAVDRLARPGGRCLDVGTGSGVLALAAARAGMEAWGIDIDPDAVRAARAAAEVNGLAARFDSTPLAEVPGRFELVLANLYAEVLVALAPDLVRVTADRLVLAGILADRAELVLAALVDDGGLSLVGRIDDGDWAFLELSR